MCIFVNVKSLTMKLKILSFVLFGLLAFGCNSDSAEINNSDVTANAVAELSIEGMTCKEGCAAKIEEKLNASFGVANASVNFEDNTAIVRFDNEKISDDEIEEIIEELHDGQYDVDITHVKASKNGAKVIYSSGNDNNIDANSFSFEVPNLFSVLKNVL